MKKTNFVAAGVAAFFIIFLMIGVQNVSAQTLVSDKYYNSVGRTVYKVGSGFFSQAGCEPDSTACIDGKQQGRAGDLGIGGLEYYNELTRGLVEKKVLGHDEIVAYDGNNLSDIWLPNCHIRVGKRWAVRPNRLKGPPIQKKVETPVSTPTPAPTPVINVNVDTKAIATAIAQNNNVAPAAWCQITVNGMTTASIKAGQQVSISWVTGNATSAVFMGNAVALSGTQVIAGPAASTMLGMIVANAQGVTAPCSASVIVQGQESGFSLCESHEGFWGKFLDVVVGAGAGAVSGRLSQGKWGWASAAGAGAGGFVGYVAGPCWGAAVGGAVGLTGFFDRDKLKKNPLSGKRGGRENGTQTWTGGFTPAQGTTAPTSGPPKVIGFTPIGSNTGNTVVPAGTGGIKPIPPGRP